MYHEKRQAIFDLSTTLRAQGRTMSFEDLLVWLNRNRFTADDGQPYQHPRGVASAVRAAYHYVADELDLGDLGAEPIAEAFTNARGDYAYER
jgi:hypothetical protein